MTDEPNSEIKFENHGTSYIVKWSDLLTLFEIEEAERAAGSGIRGLSKLTEVSVKPLILLKTMYAGRL